MALFQIDTEKRLGSEFWTNRYIVRAENLAATFSVAAAIVAIERQFHASAVTFTRYRTASTAVGDGIFSIQPVNQNGQRDPLTTLLPLFNTLRIDMSATTGRPSRKFYRGVLTEADINGDAVTQDFMVDVGELANLFPVDPGDAGIVDPQDQLLTAVTQYPFVQMRQLRRSRRKRANGGGIFQ